MLLSFFRDKDGDYSMTLLMLFLSFWPSTYVMLTRDSEEIFYAYIAAFTGLAINKQWSGRNAVANDTEMVETTSDSSSHSVSVGSRLPPSKQRVREGKTTK